MTLKLMCNTDEKYLSEKMSFDLGHLDKAISKIHVNDRKLVLRFIHCCVQISEKNTATPDYENFYNNPFNQQIDQNLPCKSLFTDCSAYEIADALRFSFTHFVSGGLLGMYEHQQNECWHPRIVIRETLKPNDIQALPDRIKIYRGCNRNEFDNNGQAWTVDLQTASKFAFTQYSQQEWFSEHARIVIQAYISREDVFYAKNEGEFEIVVNSNKLYAPEIYEKRSLKF